MLCISCWFCCSLQRHLHNADYKAEYTYVDKEEINKAMVYTMPAIFGMNEYEAVSGKYI